MQFNRRQVDIKPRRGSLLPAVALALVVVAGAVALVLDQLWLATAHRELQVAANSAALAAAQEMAHDDLLKVQFDAAQRAHAIRNSARNAALQNLVAGGRVVVNTEPHRDVRFGRPVIDPLTGHESFIETDYGPTSVIVTAHRDRRSGNPVSLLMPYLTGQPTGDVTTIAEASISNEIVAVRPFDQANVPAWPIAVLASQGGAQADWEQAIEARQGQDRFGWDRSAGEVVEEPDGIPEMVLKATSEGNVRLVDLGSNLLDEAIQTQLRHGWSWQDVQHLGSELGFSSGPLQMRSSTDFTGMPVEELQQQIGQSRVILLYQQPETSLPGSRPAISVNRLVAVRLLKVSVQNTDVEFIIQPAIVATRTAVLAQSTDELSPNPYIYRLALTQ